MYKALINYASDECLVQVFNIPLVHNRFSKFYPTCELINSGTYKTCQVNIDRIFLRLSYLVSEPTLPHCSDFQRRQLSLLCTVINTVL